MVEKRPQRKQKLKSLAHVSREGLQTLVEQMVEENPDLARQVNQRLTRMRETTHEKLKAAAAVEGTAEKKELSPDEQKQLLQTLQARFEKNRKLHENILWSDVERSLKASPERMWSIQQLEATGGEPDVIDEDRWDYVFGDCSEDTPYARANVFYDESGVDAFRWKDEYPGFDEEIGNAVDMVHQFGAELMDEHQYTDLQAYIRMDRYTNCFLRTNANLRKHGITLIAQYGRIDRMIDPGYRDQTTGFRAVVRVNKVSS